MYEGGGLPPLSNATLDEYRRAKWHETTQKKIMLAGKHKREENGLAPLPMEPEVAYLMQVFIDKVRPMVTDDQSPNSTIFVKADGQPFRDERIGTFFVVKSGVRPDTTISVTDFRKWIVTTMYKKKQKGKKIDEEPLCRLMCHSDYNAKKWYLRDSLTDQATEAAEQIKSFTKPPECDEQEDQAEF